MTDDVTPPPSAPAVNEPVAGPPVTPPPAAPPNDPPALPSQRVVSDDELLDLEAAPSDRQPLVRLTGLLGFAGRFTPRRLQQLVRVALVLLAVVAVAGAAGVATHTSDVHRAQDRLRGRTLLRLVGGSALVGSPGGVPLDGGPITTHLDFSVRNDGAEPEYVTPLGVDAPGVTVFGAAAPAVIPPGGSATLRLAVGVDCTSATLVEVPHSVTFQAWAVTTTGTPGHAPSASPSRRPGTAEARTEASPTAGSPPPAKATTVTLPLAVGSSSNGVLDGGPLGDGPAVDTFYELCGLAQVSDNGPITEYLGLAGQTTPGKKTATFQVTVRTDGTGGNTVLAASQPHVYAGLTVSSDLPKPLPLADATPVQADVTVQVTDCAALRTNLSVRDGIDSLLLDVGAELPLASEPADPRFRDPHLTRALLITGNVSAFEQDLLTSLVAACPAIK